MISLALVGAKCQDNLSGKSPRGSGVKSVRIGTRLFLAVPRPSAQA